MGKRGDEGSNPGGAAAAAGRRESTPYLPALLHFIRQRRRIERRLHSEKQKMTESGRVDARAWNPSVKEGWGGGGLKLKKNFLAGRQQAGRSLGSLILIRTATWQIDRITSHRISSVSWGGGGRESNLGGIMHDDRPAWFACLAWLSLVAGGGGGTRSLGQSVGNWRKLGIGGSIGIPENYKAGKRLKS
ncbi:unnamed protein product [Sphagnum jensenii]|uniref:Uncharacterized protein n=1 Tax=Sphagnum jensenii TaxID=128206 RepID=A0ABP0VPY1_9BRYO